MPSELIYSQHLEYNHLPVFTLENWSSSTTLQNIHSALAICSHSNCISSNRYHKRELRHCPESLRTPFPELRNLQNYFLHLDIHPRFAVLHMCHSRCDVHNLGHHSEIWISHNSTSPSLKRWTQTMFYPRNRFFTAKKVKPYIISVTEQNLQRHRDFTHENKVVTAHLYYTLDLKICLLLLIPSPRIDPKITVVQFWSTLVQRSW